MANPMLLPDQEITVRITRIAGLGDGVAEHEGMPVFVPLTVEGDMARVRITRTTRDATHAELLEVIEPGESRIAAACQHFGQCGGCSLQHLSPESYAAFKQQMLTQAIQRIGYNLEHVQPLVTGTTDSRRRAEFTVQVQKGEVKLGFLMPRSHQVVALAECPVLAPAIRAMLPALRDFAASLRKPSNLLSIALTLINQEQLDMRITLRNALSATELESLKNFASQHPTIQRLSMQDESGKRLGRLNTGGLVMVTFGGVEVELPEHAFLQASIAGQDALTKLVVKHCEGATRIADIYSGCGTYSFPLATTGSQVHAYEGDAEMIMAMQSAMRRAHLEGQMQATQRDLFKQPLSAAELRHYDAVVINPPRNGAEPQFKQIAASGIARVVVVSCNPATFARDAQSLKNAGYALQSATAVDQFYWSSHLELVASFVKA